MADTLSPEQRSRNMSRIRGKDTKPERLVRSLLHSLGYRFRLQYSKLPGRPDIVLPKYKIAIFVNGCFWHRHQNCKYAYNPKSRIEFWETKFKATIERDRVVAAQYVSSDWLQFVIWECETKNPNELANKIRDFLDVNRESANG